MSLLFTLVSTSGLVDLAIKSIAVMLLACAAAALLRRASAAWRHLVWCLSVVSLLLLPALALTLPTWRVTWLPRWAAEQTHVAATGQPALAKADAIEPLDDQSPTTILLPPSAPVAATEAHASPSATAIETTSPPRGPVPWLAIGWAAGVLLSLVPLVVGLWQLAVLHRRSRVIDDPRWLVMLEELRRQLAVRRSVQLRQTATALLPLTWGALRPVLLVPAEASAWPDGRRRLVLLHELAHVRRWDWLTQLVAHVACAMYWFNPLVWLAARQMRIERERACDDLVLASGARASDYAQELLAVAAGLSNSQLSPLVAVPMARRGALEHRLRGILDSSRSRAALTTAAVCLGAALAAAATSPLAMLRAAPPESAKPATEEAKQEPPVKEKPAAEKPGDHPAEKPAEQPAAKAVTTRGKAEKSKDVGQPPAQPNEQPAKSDQERMVGNWFIMNDDSMRKGEMWVIYDDTILMYAKHSGPITRRYVHRLDASKVPKQIDITVTLVNGSPVGVIKGLYVLDGDELRLCLAALGKDRPAAFAKKPGPGELLILQRNPHGTTPPKAKEEGPADKIDTVKNVTVHGKVVDDVTGEPIERLVRQSGQFDPADPTKVAWGGVEYRSEARDGSFSATVRWAEGWTYRIVADGYIPQPVLTSAPPAGKTEIRVTIRLKRGPTVRGVVLDHAGKPLHDAAVFAVGPTLLKLAAGQAWRHDGIDEYARFVRTDEQGRFELPVGEAKSLAVSHALFDAWPAAIPPGGEVTIQLPEPARVEIELDIEGADRQSVIFYQLLAHDVPEFAGLQSSREVSIANPGKVSLAALPPGKYQLCRNVQNRLKGIGMGAMLERRYFELQPGETKVIHYVREQGARVRGKATWPADTKVMGIVISIQEEKPERDEREWPTIYTSHAVEEDGTFLTERVAPGTYLLVAIAYTPLRGPPERLSTGTPVPSHRAQIRIEVPADGELAVGKLALKPIPSGE